MGLVGVVTGATGMIVLVGCGGLCLVSGCGGRAFSGASMWCVERWWVVSWLVGGRRGCRCGSWRAGSGCGGGPGRGRPGPRRFGLAWFALVAGPGGGGGAQGGEGGGEHGSLESLVAAVGDVLTPDGGA